MRGLAFVLGTGALVSSCHLASSSDPPTCPTGYGADLGRCVVDPSASTAITITSAAGGTACVGPVSLHRPPTVAPDPLHVASGAAFHFDNQDVMDHEVRGADGQLWASVAKGQSSPDHAIVKTGSWAYTVSGCRGGTVVVE